MAPDPCILSFWGYKPARAVYGSGIRSPDAKIASIDVAGKGVIFEAVRFTALVPASPFKLTAIHPVDAYIWLLGEDDYILLELENGYRVPVPPHTYVPVKEDGTVHLIEPGDSIVGKHVPLQIYNIPHSIKFPPISEVRALIEAYLMTLVESTERYIEVQSPLMFSEALHKVKKCVIDLRTEDDTELGRFRLYRDCYYTDVIEELASDPDSIYTRYNTFTDFLLLAEAVKSLTGLTLKLPLSDTVLAKVAGLQVLGSVAGRLVTAVVKDSMIHITIERKPGIHWVQVKDAKPSTGNAYYVSPVGTDYYILNALPIYARPSLGKSKYD